MSLQIHITQNSEVWDQVPNLQALVERGIHLALQKVLATEIGAHDIHVDVTLTDEPEITRINKQFRGKEGPTNVLSFPQYESVEQIQHQSEFILLGDMVFSYTTLKNEAESEGKTFEDHMTHLLVHSALHLVGFDHKEDMQAKQMEALEIQLLSEVGILNPYLID